MRKAVKHEAFLEQREQVASRSHKVGVLASRKGLSPSQLYVTLMPFQIAGELRYTPTHNGFPTSTNGLPGSDQQLVRPSYTLSHEECQLQIGILISGLISIFIK